jgi:hypothetical protein
MKPNFQNISHLNTRQLSMEIYDSLAVTNRITLFEILSDDIYCQVGENESFVFSVEVRGDDTEFFLFDMNFILSNHGDFEIYKNKILTVIKSSLCGSYEIEIVKFNSITLKVAIVFQKTLRIGLYENLLSSFFSLFKYSLTHRIKEGRAITG